MAATASAKSIDLSSSSTWPVVLGASITKHDRGHGSTSIRYNHREQATPRESTQIHLSAKPSSKGYLARLRDGDQEFIYDGSGRVVSDNYVLVLRGQGDDARATLERVNADYALNVIATPTEQDAKLLRKKYPQLDPRDDTDRLDIAAGDDADNDEPNTNNPFDFRHYLDADLSDDAPQQSRPGSTANTPQITPARSTNTPSHRSNKPSTSNDTARRKRKPVPDATSSTSKRAKTASSVSKASGTQQVPSVQISRRATLRPEDEDVQEDDSGELILENEDDAAKGSNKHSAMAMALSGQLGPGPISLRSAASSPASPFHSPAPQRFARSDSQEDDESIKSGHVSDGQDGGDEREDGDVDDFELPSPVQDRRHNVQPDMNVDDAMDEDEDDLSKELAKAMAEDESASAMKHQSEEESEEE